MTKKPTTKKTHKPQTTKAAKLPAMTQGEIARLLDVTQQRCSQLVQEGVFAPLKSGKLDPFVCVPAYVRSIKIDGGMGRIRAAKAIEIETKNAKERAELISLEDVNYCVGNIIHSFCGELHGVAAASTRDLPLRETIQNNINFAIERCKARLGAMADDAKAGKPIADDAGGPDDGDD